MTHLPECIYAWSRANRVLRGGAVMWVTNPPAAHLRCIYPRK
jgi:hypothetical protein